MIQNFGCLDQRPITLFPYFLLSTHFVDKTHNKKVLNLKSLSPNTFVPKGDKGLTTMLVIILFNSLQLLRVTYFALTHSGLSSAELFTHASMSLPKTLLKVFEKSGTYQKCIPQYREQQWISFKRANEWTQYLSIMSIDCWQVTVGKTVRGVWRSMQEIFFVHHL